MHKLPEATWFSNAFAVCSGIWGKITELAAENQCSRQTAYRHAAIAREALERRRDPRYEDLLAEKDRLAQENDELVGSLRGFNSISQRIAGPSLRPGRPPWA